MSHACKIAVIGGGLAGCECAYALASQDLPVTLFEMKPERFSPAHRSPDLAELVCSNSLRSDDPQSAIGRLKEELAALGGLCLTVSRACRIPAGKALAVDRKGFSREITRRVTENRRITLIRREIRSLNPNEDTTLAGFTHLVISAGPLAAPDLAASLARLTGDGQLYFYDAIAPIVHGESLDQERIFRASRYEKTGDYLNCPMNREEYLAFYHALMEAEKASTHDFEEERHFEGCMPIEALAARGEKTLLFGPFKPVGLTDPATGRRPFALVQLRAENLNQDMFGLVGCQTKLLQGEQERIFRMIPGLARAEFARYGSMHRNTYINAPAALNADLSLRAAPHIFLAGQITGVEGYVESMASGLWLGLSLGAALRGVPLPPPPQESVLGGLLAHLQTPAKHFQPSNAQYGLTPALPPTNQADKPDKKLPRTSSRERYAERARSAFAAWMNKAALCL
ncbi:MAG: methylenetetrahydrofolate--tRNA-(uracil(54)-C(5))-methyltransferase (FADH(2)-oxidizing) TrmFO [Desulfovibrionaceae bacterium]|nr:methylenetetrahydrofolate--tRNA-(uracil(54)-C(5))-methyltransferase (FADH(2)-oxidizing) TrmFO [Desulfovibrionaceae bacterium]